MAITTVRPTGTPAGGGWTATGAADVMTALSDNTDASYATGPVLTDCRESVGDIALAANQRVASVKYRIRASKGTGSGTTDLRVRAYDPTTGLYGAEDRYTSLPVAGSWTEYTGAARTTDPNGVEWTDAVVDRIHVQLRNRSAGYAHRVAALYVDIDIRTRATVDVTAPTGVVSTTSQPTVFTTFTDPDGDIGRAYHLRVFSAAQYGIGGFDPATSPATYVSDSIGYPSHGEIHIPQSLTNNTTYRAYVRVAKWHNTEYWYSDWDYTQFTITLTPPTTPTVAAVYDSAGHDVDLTVTVAAPPGGTTAQSVLVERTDGTGWRAIGPAVAMGAVAGTVTLTDRAAPRGVELTYRATVTATITGQPVSSAPGSSAPLTITLDKRWILCTVAVDGAGLDWIGANVVGEPAVTVEESAGVFRPLGRSNAVVITSGVHGEDGTLTVIARADWAAARAVLRSTDPVFVSDPFGGNRFVRFTSRAWSLLGTLAAPRRPIEVGYVEVDAPADLTTDVVVT